MDLRQYIRDVPDFPQKGIVFKDITPLLAHPAAFKYVIDGLAERFRGRGVDAVVGIEARGFIFGAPLAVALGAAFVPIRKKGKLPGATVQAEYALEYGSATVEMHRDGVLPGKRALLVDDVLATGGTLAAAQALVEKLGAHVGGMAVLLEIAALGGRGKLKGTEIFSLLTY
ncbi:MAG: adenine phosphoribosyltransferase [Dehalococcoidia bacterium]|nr:adenine phosphoribosyltransferase [Dehalococcoidia bacterium]